MTKFFPFPSLHPRTVPALPKLWRASLYDGLRGPGLTNRETSGSDARETSALRSVAHRCVLGKGGVKAAKDKREGDGASPLGVWRLKWVYYRPDRLARPRTALPTVPLSPEDGWCDAVEHPLYNQPVSLPFPASHERLWREDHAYDLIVVLNHNDGTPKRGLGSAIFWHLAQPDWRPTEGCIAVTQNTLEIVLARAVMGDQVEICS